MILMDFPVDMTNSILNDKKISLDMEKYRSFVKSIKNYKKSWVGLVIKIMKKIDKAFLKNLQKHSFCGYENNSCNSKLLNIIENGYVG